MGGTLFEVFGFIAAFLIGVPLARLGIKKKISSRVGEIGVIEKRGYYKPNETGRSLGKSTTYGGNIETITTHAAFLGISYLVVLGFAWLVFSGDIDKTIAAFIMANGAAAMGRNVTIFFTFWGLNILRRPEKVKVKKTFIEKMFGFMMPRGTIQRGLSRMNMGGAGALMIRNIMKSKGVSSLEEYLLSLDRENSPILACLSNIQN